MSISRDDVREAVERYIPRTANFARSADLGELNREEVFDRLLHIVLSALLVDPDAVFFSVYLSTQRLLQDIQVALDALIDLDSIDQLRGISPLPPIRLEDLSKLEDAQSSLIGMSAALVDNLFGINQFNAFSEDITSFLVESVVPNVLNGGNNEKSSAAIRGSLQKVADAWDAVLERRAQIPTAVEEYENLDLRVQVSSTVISSIREKIIELRTTLPTLATTEHGKQSEQILVDLAAAVASLRVIALSPTPFGQQILGPLDDGYTDAEYLLTEGTATIEPLRPLLKGDDGKLFFDSVLVSSAGQTVTDGDDFTAEFTDPDVSDFTTVVSAGQFLTLVNSGERFQLNAVVAAALTLDGETRHLAASPQRYVVTETPPGTFFRSLETDFWDEYTGGRTASTVLLSGTNGSWVRIDKVVGSDGRNIKAQGTAGVARPFKAEGGFGLQDGGGTAFLDVTTPAAFLSDGVLPGDHLLVDGANATGNPYTVLSLVAEEALFVVETFPGPGDFSSDWIVEEADADHLFVVDEDVFERGVVVGDVIFFLNVGPILTAEITEIRGVNLLLTDFFFDENQAGIEWEIRYSDLLFISDTANFLSNNVVPGDILEVQGVEDYTIVSVDSQTQLTVDPEIDSFFVGKNFLVYPDPTITTKFVQTDVDFEAHGIGAFFEGVQVILNAETGDLNVVRLDPDDPVQALRVETPVSVDAGPLNWTLRAGDETDLFNDPSGPFANYEAGDIIVYRPGTVDERRVGIQEVLGPQSVRLAGTLPQGEVDIPYAVISVCKGGVQLIVSGRRHSVISVVDRHTLQVQPPLALTIGKDVEFLIVRSGSTPLAYHLVDEVTAQTFGVQGFPASIVGSDFELMSGQQVKGRVTARVDANDDTRFESFNITAQLRIGQRKAAYRLRTLLSNTTNKFKTDSSSPLPAAGDILTVWGQARTFEILEVALVGSDIVLTIDGLLPARLEEQSFVVVRGGSRNHGRFLLLQQKLATLAQDDDTSSLRLAVAEVLLDFGSNTQPIAAGVGADLTFDEDGDGLTDTITVSTATFVTDGVEFGHRVDVVYPGPTSRRSYVIEVVSETVLKVDPAVPVSVTPLAWAIVRSSVSNALDDVLQLRTQMEDLQEIVNLYVVEQNATVLNALNMLKKHRMDRAIDLFYDGQLAEFVAMESTDSSYASQARSSIQTVGAATTPSEDVVSSSSQQVSSGNNLSGVDPVTGKAAPSSTFASATQSQAIGTDEVETRIALSKAVTELVADEQIRSMLTLSLDEARNRGIYELNGEIQSGVISDQDSTLPWLDKTGSVKDRLIEKAQAAMDAIQYMLDHPDEFDDVASEDSG